MNHTCLYGYLLYPHSDQNVFGDGNFVLTNLNVMNMKENIPGICMINDMHYFLTHLLISQEISHHCWRYSEMSYL